MLNRRQLITLSGGVGAAVLLGREMAQGSRAPGPLANEHHRHRFMNHAARKRAAATPGVPPFSVPMPLPRVLVPTSTGADVDTYTLPMKATTAEILPGVLTPVLTFGGQFVGPTIKAKSGRRVEVKFRNDLAEPANVHLHGGHTPAASDGHPMDLIAPGTAKLNTYPNQQRGRTLWYHDHSHHTEAEHVFRGLAGLYLIEDPDEARLGLPSGRYDVPLMLRDAKFDDDGTINYSPYDDVTMRTTLLVNGRPQPYFEVCARKYRFRVVNASNHRTYKLDLGGVEMIQIGSDGGLLPNPVRRTTLQLSPAERIEVVIDFKPFAIGKQLVLADETGPVLRFDVVRTAADDSRVPSVLRPLPALPPAGKTREVTLGLNDTQDSFWIDGKPFDPNRVDITIKRGSTEIWNVHNLDGEFNIGHNFHIHLVQFRVLDRAGGPPLPGESGFKDTVDIPPGSSVRLQATFADFLGRYTYHCHMMEHASAFDMMAQMEIVA